VETFGTMKKKEKTEYILEQMRLCLLKKDFVRTQIISKKIHPRVLNEEGFGELKIRFNKLMIQYYLNDRNHLEIANCYWHIYQTEQEETAKLGVFAWFIP
jgi:26S proteasome regulatory subunit N5